MNYTYEKITKVTREFRDLAGDLLRSDTDTFNSNINFFRNFCEEEEIIQEILKPIKERIFNFDDWYNNAITPKSSFVGSGDATLPQNKLDALKVIYEMLWNENSYKLLLNFGYATMYSQYLDEQLRKVNDKVTNIFVRYIIRQLEDKVELVKPQSGQNIQNWYVNAPSNIANQSSNVNQQLNISNPDIQKAIEELRIAIEKSELNRADKDDALETIDMIDEEVSKEVPSQSRIKKYLNLLPQMDNIVSIAANIVSMFN